MADELRPDIEAARAAMKATIGAKREVERLESHLAPGETVEMLATGTSNGSGTGLLALTSHRLLFVFEGRMKTGSEDLPFDRIASIQWNAGMMMGKVHVNMAGAVVTIANVEKAAGAEIVNRVRTRLAAGAPAAPAQPVETAPDHIAQLQQLASLRDAGVLSEDEFAAKKTEILGRI